MKNYNSRIFWHFTGSPINIKWDEVHQPNDIISAGKLKSIEESIEILKKIIKSKTLMAKCSEKVYGHRTTEKFCCVTDIPLSHLDCHREFYGDIAIGFSSNRIYEEFNPVLYIPKSQVVKKAIEFTDSFTKIDSLSKVDIDEESAFFSGFTKNEDGTWNMPITEIGYPNNTKLERHFLNYLKITKFSDNPGESFYQEKEWRKIDDFFFNMEDIEA